MRCKHGLPTEFCSACLPAKPIRAHGGKSTPSQRIVLTRSTRVVDINKLCMNCHKEFEHFELTVCQYNDGPLNINKTKTFWNGSRVITREWSEQVGVKRSSGKLCQGCMTNPDLDAKPTYLATPADETIGGKSYKGLNTRYVR